MDIAFLINDRHELKPTMTTAMLVYAAHREGHGVRLVEVSSLVRSGDGSVQALCVPIRATKTPSTFESFLEAVWRARPQMTPLDRVDAVWSRTNPARDPRHGLHVFADWVLTDLERRGIPVLNTPSALRLARDKTYLTRLPPRLPPRTRVATTEAPLLDFLAEMDRGVLKPAQGTRGRGVFLLSGNDSNARAVLEMLLAEGPVVAQEYIEGAELGDTRVLVAGGAPVEVDGRWAAVWRIPAGADHRSNVHSGGKAVPAELDEHQRDVVRAVASKLHEDGIWLAGIDLIGDRVCEINVAAPGGIHDASRFEDRDFAAALVRAFVLAARQTNAAPGRTVAACA